MLRDDVVEAVRDGRFHVWLGEDVDDALRLLTGTRAGEPDATGTYPEGTVHRAVADRLAQYADTLRALTGKTETAPEPQLV